MACVVTPNITPVLLLKVKDCTATNRWRPFHDPAVFVNHIVDFKYNDLNACVNVSFDFICRTYSSLFAMSN